MTIASYFHLFGFWCYVDVRFSWSAVLSGCWDIGVHIPLVVSGRGTEWKWMLVQLISKIWDQRQKYFSFCFKDFYIIFMHCSFLLMSVFISTIQSIPCKWNNIRLIMQCRRFNHTWIFMTLLCLLCGVKCHIRQHLCCYRVKRDLMGHKRTRC
jgi:hypothetical protein